METWYTARYPLSQTGVLGEAAKMQTEYTQIFVLSGSPKDALVLADLEPHDNYHHYYFSPGAMRIARQLILDHGGVPCSRPERKTIKLVVGDANSLDRLLPTEGRN